MIHRGMRHVDQMLVAQNFNVQSVTYKKLGGEIGASVAAVRKDNSDYIDELHKEIAEICTRRDLKVNDVLIAGSSPERYEAYSTSIMENGPQSNAVLKALEVDLAKIRTNLTLIEMTKNENEYHKRLADNIEPNRSFDLTYDELVQLGF